VAHRIEYMIPGARESHLTSAAAAGASCPSTVVVVLWRCVSRAPHVPFGRRLDDGGTAAAADGRRCPM